MVSLFLHGVGIGAALVSSFSASQRGAIAAGFPDGMETYGMISGMWSSVFALGEWSTIVFLLPLHALKVMPLEKIFGLF